MIFTDCKDVSTCICLRTIYALILFHPVWSDIATGWVNESMINDLTGIIRERDFANVKNVEPRPATTKTETFLWHVKIDGFKTFNDLVFRRRSFFSLTKGKNCGQHKIAKNDDEFRALQEYTSFETYVFWPILIFRLSAHSIRHSARPWISVFCHIPVQFTRKIPLLQITCLKL